MSDKRGWNRDEGPRQNSGGNAGPVDEEAKRATTNDPVDRESENRATNEGMTAKPSKNAG